MFMDPTKRQINFEANVFSEQVVLDHAKHDIEGLLKVAQERLPAETTPHRIIHLVKIETDNTHMNNILDIYGSVVAQENQRLRENNVPIHLSVTNGTGGSIYFVAANYEPVEKLHLDYPITLNLKNTKQSDYLELVRGMNLPKDEEEQLVALVPKIYQLASEGKLDLQAVTIDKTNVGLQIAGIEETKPSSIHLDEKTANALLAIVNEDMRNHESHEKYLPRIQRLGNAIIRVLRTNISLQDDVNNILPPQELASAMLAYKEDNSKGKPPANCIGVSLLTNELLHLSGYESSIITLHAINKYGEEHNGHATAAVVADGWLIDPALLVEPKKISKITFDKKDKGYTKFAKDMEKIYLTELGNGKDDNQKPVMLEFHEDREENEIKALYLLENGTRIKKHGKESEGNAEILEASRINPKNFYAIYSAISIYKSKAEISEKERNEIDALYSQMSKTESDLYIANYYAAQTLFNVQNESGTKPFLESAYGHAKKATEAFERDGNKFYFGYLWLNITAKTLELKEEAINAEIKMKECERPAEK